MKSTASESKPMYFATADDLRRWLTTNAATAPQLLVGFTKRSAGSSSLTWPEAVDEALCVGWVDGVRHRVDDARYTVRFTPRKPGSTWSAKNIDRVAALNERGRMTRAGLAAFAARTEKKSRTYSYEQPKSAELTSQEIREFKKQASAWRHFEASPQSYRKKAIWWVVSAKQDETRARRLARVIAASAAGKRLG